MNLQNIPSKSHDIRHLFRATPEQKETVKVEPIDNTIKLKLSLYDRIPSIDKLVEVKDLTTDTIVIFKDNNQEVQYIVKDIDKTELGHATITFGKGE